jgi:stage V sporulation protein G
LRAAHCNQCGVRLKEQIAAKDDEGRAKLYADIAHPINSVCREMIQTRVIKSYQEEKSRSLLPGYVPQSYDDFDAGEEAPAAAPAKQASLESTQIQGAEKPRGPHKIPPRAPAVSLPAQRPAQQQAAERPRNNGGFGAGVFE